MKQKKIKVLIIDNFDSFTYNIVYLLNSLDIKPKVMQNTCSLDDIKALDFSHLIISAGPGNPNSAGVSMDAIRHFAKKQYSKRKILGICLGHQCIAQVFGGEVIKMSNPSHAKIATLTPASTRKNVLFKGIKKSVKLALYHSLKVKLNIKTCKALGYSEDGVLMALKVKRRKIYGIQFHPESILQESGRRIMKNFLQ